MLSHCGCGRKIAYLRRQIRRLRRRLARFHGRRKRPYSAPAEDTRRLLRLREYEFLKQAEAGIQAFARLAAEERRDRRENEDEAA